MPEKQMNCLFSTPNNDMAHVNLSKPLTAKLFYSVRIGEICEQPLANEQSGNVSSAHHRQTRCSFPARWHGYDCLRD